MEWVVLGWNTPAIEFYKKTGAHILDDWKTVQMDELAIKNYLEQKTKEMEQMRKVPNELTPYYKERVRQYFNKVGKI